MTKTPSAASQLPENKWRPKYHFTAHDKWINDPNGLVFVDGTYHLFFQMNPDDSTWGNMHWGHATSQDLLHWQSQDIALFADPKGLGYIFSGGAVIDKNNTSGFKSNDNAPIVATFTHHTEDEVQMQSLAFSTDKGMTFTQYAGNPVIPNTGLKDFRDPKVIWHQPTQSWVMSLAAGDCAQFYSSPNLKEWTLLSEFGKHHGAKDVLWECPDLFPLICKKTGISKWVLLISINPGGPNGGSAMMYFVGEFDGKQFTPEDDNIRWLDFGTDFYAGITWDGLQDTSNKRIIIAWMSNWEYARNTPTDKWRGAMTLPREINLTMLEGEYLLSQLPSANLSAVTQDLKTYTNKLNDEQTYAISESCEMDLLLTNISQDNVIIAQLTNDCGESVTLSLDVANKQASLDRSKCKWSTEHFCGLMKGELPMLQASQIKVKILVDVSTIEVFINDGLSTFSAVFYADTPVSSLVISGQNVEQVSVSARINILA